MKFKVGDKVKIISKKNGDEYTTYGFEIGNICKIMEIDKDRLTIFNEHHKGYIFKYNVELVREITKSDLKDGDIVTYRNGNKRTVISGKLIDENGMGTKYLRSYDEQIKDKNGCRNLDIVKVERPVKYETVFERKEEILDKTEKRYLANVIRPFRHEIETIEKTTKVGGDSSLCYLNILLKNNDMANLPDFKKNSMYEGMEVNKKYTLKELGL